MADLQGLQISPVPDNAVAKPPRRVLWKWSLALTAAVFLFLMWQCGSAFYMGRQLSEKAVQNFHAQLDSGRYEDICREADEAFSEGQKHDELVQVLGAVHRKLGNALVANQVNTNVSATTYLRNIHSIAVSDKLF